MTPHTPPDPSFALHHGSGAAMWQLADGAADLVLTSPPYYPPTLEAVLRRPLSRQVDIDAVERSITELAVSLQPVFAEVARVLRGDGKLIVQTRDLRYGGYLIGPIDTHRRLAEAAGFRLLTEIAWRSSPAPFSRGGARRSLWDTGHFVTETTEKFLVLARGPLLGGTGGPPVDAPHVYAEPVWTLPGQGARSTHQHESPLSVLRRLIQLYSVPGDLVVDPFCGHGTTLVAAIESGRSAAGWDIDGDCITVARGKVAAARAGSGPAC